MILSTKVGMVSKRVYLLETGDRDRARKLQKLDRPVPNSWPSWARNRTTSLRQREE